MIEKVNPMHPDKVADRIAGAIVDIAYASEENPKIAAEVLVSSILLLSMQTIMSLPDTEGLWLQRKKALRKFRAYLSII